VLFLLAFNRQKIKNRVRTLEIEQKMLRMQMNSHFIFNSLAIIQNFILSSDIKKASDHLSNFAKLMRNLLYFSREKFINIDDEINTLKLYIDFQKARFNNKFDYKINVDEKIDTENTLIPPLIIQPFVENAIEHGLSKINYNGLLEINFEISDNLLKINILDNGIGIEKSLENKPKTKHKSLAIEISKERIKTLLPKKYRKNYFKIIDRKYEQTHGTRVSFFLPLVEEF
jgi:LytS/YehU family sensor histidine kinase